MAIPDYDNFTVLEELEPFRNLTKTEIETRPYPEAPLTNTTLGELAQTVADMASEKLMARLECDDV